MDGHSRHRPRHFVGEALGDAGIEDARQSVLGVDRGPVDQQARRFDLHGHLGKLELHGLELHDGLAELPALLNVFEHVLEGARGLANRHGRVAAPFQVEGRHQPAETPGRQDDVCGRDLHVGEEDVGGRDAAKAHEPFPLAEGDAGGVPFHVDRADALGARGVGQTAVHHVAVRVAAARAPALGAVEDDGAVPDLAPGLEVGEGGAGLGFGHGHRDRDLPRAHPGDDPRLQVLARQVLDGADRTDTGFEYGKGDGGRDLGEFLDHQQGVQVSEAKPAVGRGHVDAEKAHLRVPF